MGRLFALAAMLLAAVTAAGSVWDRAATPSQGPAAAIGGTSRGCLAGGSALPVQGPGYQVLRGNHNRRYGHPELTAFIQDLARTAGARGWEGLWVGDLSLPRGGPFAKGHASHQTGLDVDLYLNPVAAGAAQAQRSVVAADGAGVDRRVWTVSHAALLQAVAEDPRVDRLFINPAIKQHLCRGAEGDRDWLRKLRPWWGHAAHVHVRLVCPAGDALCESQEPLPAGDGCGADLAWWFSEEATTALKERRAARKPPTLEDLPEACRSVFAVP